LVGWKLKKIGKRVLFVLIIFIFNIILGGCSKEIIEEVGNKVLSKSNNVSIPIEAYESQENLDLRIIQINLGSGNIIKINLDERLSEDLLERLNADELMVVKNGYYAKYGYNLPDTRYVDYFSQYQWYEPSNDNVES
jgi:hypothetical protein